MKLASFFFSWQSRRGGAEEHELRAPVNESTTLPTVEEDNATSCPESLKCSPFEEEFEKQPLRLRKKIIAYQDAIQPHTDEGGEAYYIGDAYEPINERWALEWEIEGRDRPYLQHIKRLSRSKTWHHLEYLAHWMEVTAAPPKWKFLRKDPGLSSRDMRAQRTKVCKLDWIEGYAQPEKRYYNTTPDLKSALEISPQPSLHNSKQVQTRLLIVEDLSRDVVEMLGTFYDIDSLFFLSHINDYLFHNTRDRWVELPSLHVDARNRSHFTLQYLRPWYFENEESFKQAERQSGMFNVLRRLDSDRSRQILQNGLLDREGASVTLTRAKTSLWIKPRTKGDPVTAILLVDPSINVEKGHPLWRGNRPFAETPTMESCRSQEGRERASGLAHGSSLFDEVVYWTSKLTPQELTSLDSDPRCIAIPMLKHVLADWLTVLKYMTAQLGLIEWQKRQPHWGAGKTTSEMGDLMKKLAPWRRNIGYYRVMIIEAIQRLFPEETLLQIPPSSGGASSNLLPPPPPPPPPASGGILSSLLFSDFKILDYQITACENRILTIQTSAANGINIEESRRQIAQNKELARLTFLATIFIPLSFTSSFLSMSPDFYQATGTIWLFFAIGVPITLLALIVIDVTHPDPERSFCRAYWRKRRKVSRPNAIGGGMEPDTTRRMPETTTTPTATTLGRANTIYHTT